MIEAICRMAIAQLNQRNRWEAFRNYRSHPPNSVKHRTLSKAIAALNAAI